MNIPAAAMLPPKPAGDTLKPKLPELAGNGASPGEANNFSELLDAPLQDPNLVSDENLLSIEMQDQMELVPALEEFADLVQPGELIADNAELVENTDELMPVADPVLETQPQTDELHLEPVLADTGMNEVIEEKKFDLSDNQETRVLEGAEAALIQPVQNLSSVRNGANPASSQLEIPVSMTSPKNPTLVPGVALSDISKPAGNTMPAESALASLARNIVGKGEGIQTVPLAPEQFSKVTGVKKETHIAFFQPSTTGQLPGIISKTVTEIRNTGAVDLAALDQANAANKPLAKLTVQLLPRNLGLVEVTLQRQDGAISIQINTETAEAERLIARENNAIKDTLRSAGLLLGEIKVQTVTSADRDFAMRMDNSSSEQMNLQQNSSSSGRDGAEENRFEAQSDVVNSNTSQASDNGLEAETQPDGLYL